MKQVVPITGGSDGLGRPQFRNEIEFGDGP